MAATWTEKRYPQLMADGGGGAGWTDPANAEGAPDEVAATNAGATTNSLLGSLCKFQVFDEATMVAILLHTRRRKSGGGGTLDSVVRLLKAGAPVGNDEAKGATFWPLAFATEIYDGSLGADPVWGIGGIMTPADYRAAGFGVELGAINAAATAEIDSVQIHLRYTTPRVWMGMHLRRSPTKRWFGE